MSDRAALTIAGGLLALIFLLALGAAGSSWTPNEAVGVKAEQQTSKRVDNQKAGSQISPEAKKSAVSAKGDGEAKKGETDENASEFWRPIFGYRFKVTDSLLVLFTGFLAWSTYGLQRSTVGLQRAADEQAKITSNLFSVDQRPWLNVSLTVADDDPAFNDDGSITLKLHSVVKNIGKSPAFEAGNGTLIHVGYEGFQEQFDAMRSFTEAQSFSKGKTIFPGDDDSWDYPMVIYKKYIEQSRAIEEGIPMQFIIIGYHYKSGFSDDPLETIRMYKFGIGSFEGALPLHSEEAAGRKVQLHLWKELIT